MAKFATGQSWKQKPKQYQGRGVDQNKDWKGNYEYCIVKRDLAGGVEVFSFELDNEFHEKVDFAGNVYQVSKDGSIHERRTGFSNMNAKHSMATTCDGNVDCYTGGVTRQIMAAGQDITVDGNQTKMVSGSVTEFSAKSSGYCEYNVGKKCINAEGGIGLGVNKGNSKKSYLRMEPDGTFHLQVTPAGESGGKATMKIDPDGTVTVTSAKTVNFNVEQEMTIKAKALKIDAPVTINPDSGTALEMNGNFSHTGNYNQTGVHIDDNGPHTA